MNDRKPVKLTPAQRRALETIAAGGVTYRPGRFSTDRPTITVPDGAQAITPAVFRHLMQQAMIAGTEPVKLTPYGADVLAGTVRPPIKATYTVTLDGQTIATAEVDVDPYAEALHDPGERDLYLARLASTVTARRLTATITLPADAIPTTSKRPARKRTPASAAETPAAEVKPRATATRSRRAR